MSPKGIKKGIHAGDISTISPKKGKKNQVLDNREKVL